MDLDTLTAEAEAMAESNRPGLRGHVEREIGDYIAAVLWDVVTVPQLDAGPEEARRVVRETLDGLADMMRRGDERMLRAGRDVARGAAIKAHRDGGAR